VQYSRFALFLLLLLIPFGAAACTNQDKPTPGVNPTEVPLSTIALVAMAGATPTLQSATHTITLAPTKTALPVATGTIRPVSTTRVVPTATHTPKPTPTPIIVTVAAPPGLLYTDDKGQWQIKTDGRPALIISNTEAILSPNRQMAVISPDCHCSGDRNYQLINLNSGHIDILGANLWGFKWSLDSRYIYYEAESSNRLTDIWVFDVALGNKRNLSNTSRRHEGSISIWPNQPDYLFFYSWPIDIIADGEGWLGYSTAMKTDGTEYQVISNDLGTGLVALSPDGRTIAYSDWERAWYYRLGAKAQLFPWQNFGLTGLKNVRFYSLSWSPDAQKIAWSMSGEDRTGRIGGVGIFDLQAGTAHFLKGWSHLEWSSSQRRIVGLRPSLKPGSNYGVWVANADAENAHLLTDVFNSIDGECPWVWSPDEQWLAFNCINAVNSTLNQGVWLAEVSTGRLLKTNLANTAKVRGWIALDQ
jgi:hypothetical protein